MQPKQNHSPFNPSKKSLKATTLYPGKLKDVLSVTSCKEQVEKNYLLKFQIALPAKYSAATLKTNWRFLDAVMMGMSKPLGISNPGRVAIFHLADVTQLAVDATPGAKAATALACNIE